MVLRSQPGLACSLIVLGLAAAGGFDRPASYAQQSRVQGVAVTSEVEGQAVIFSIIPDGSTVEEGQLVCELDATPLKEALARRQIIVEAAEEACREARKAREAAEIAAAEYENTTAKKDLSTTDGEIKLAESDLARSADRVGWARRMQEKGFVARATLVSEELNYQKAKFSLEQAQAKMNVLQAYGKPRAVKELASQIDKARFDERATGRYLELEQGKRAHLREQVDRCRIFSPIAGKLVFVRLKGEPGGSAGAFPRAGLRVHHGEVLARVIPDQGARPQPVGHAPLEHHGQGAAAPIVLRSPVAGDSTVLSILPLDTQVKKGQPVCELDASDLNDELAAQRLAAAQADYDLATRKNVLEIAELSLKEYQEGRYALEQLSLQGEIKITKAETVLAEKELAQARKDAGEDSQAARRSDLALERLHFGLEQAHARLRMLEKLTHPRQVRTLEMGVAQARKEAELATRRLELEQGKTVHLERLIALCKMVSPRDGRVVGSHAVAGQIVKEGQPLVTIEPAEESGKR